MPSDLYVLFTASRWLLIAAWGNCWLRRRNRSLQNSVQRGCKWRPPFCGTGALCMAPERRSWMKRPHDIAIKKSCRMAISCLQCIVVLGILEASILPVCFLAMPSYRSLKMSILSFWRAHGRDPPFFHLQVQVSQYKIGSVQMPWDHSSLGIAFCQWVHQEQAEHWQASKRSPCNCCWAPWAAISSWACGRSRSLFGLWTLCFASSRHR